MFEFFKDMYLESKGINSDEYREKQKKELEEKKKDIFIFSRGVKILIFIFGILYLFLTGSNISAIKSAGLLNVFTMLRYVFLILCDALILTFTAIGTRKMEIAALVLIFVFAGVQYFTIWFV